MHQLRSLLNNSIALSLIVLTLAPPLARAASANTKKIETEIMSSVTVVGEKTSRFTVSKTATGGRVRLENSDGFRRERRLSSNDLKSIVKEFGRLPSVKKMPSECERGRSYVQSKPAGRKATTKMGCLVGRSMSAQAFTRFSNMLVIPL